MLKLNAMLTPLDLDKPKSYPYITFDELPDESWAIAGKLLDEE